MKSARRGETRPENGTVTIKVGEIGPNHRHRIIAHIIRANTCMIINCLMVLLCCMHTIEKPSRIKTSRVRIRKDTRNEESLDRQLTHLQSLRTHRFATVRNQTGRLLEGLAQVVREPLVLILLGSQLHKLSLH